MHLVKPGPSVDVGYHLSHALPRILKDCVLLKSARKCTVSEVNFASWTPLFQASSLIWAWERM